MRATGLTLTGTALWLGGAAGSAEQPTERPIENRAVLATAMWIRVIPNLLVGGALCESNANGRKVAS